MQGFDSEMDRYQEEPFGRRHTSSPLFNRSTLHHIRQPGMRGGSRWGYFRRPYSYEIRMANTLVRQASFVGRKLHRKGSGGDRQLDHQAKRRRLLRYVIGTFVWNVIERGKYEDLMEAQRFCAFLISAWAKAVTPSSHQMVSARKFLDSNVQAKEFDRERGAWKKYYLEKLRSRKKNAGAALVVRRLDSKERTKHV